MAILTVPTYTDFGSMGSFVSTIQWELFRIGFGNATEKISGILEEGEGLARAIQELQTCAKIDADGQFGPETRAAYARINGKQIEDSDTWNAHAGVNLWKHPNEDALRIFTPPNFNSIMPFNLPEHVNVTSFLDNSRMRNKANIIRYSNHPKTIALICSTSQERHYKEAMAWKKLISEVDIRQVVGNLSESMVASLTATISGRPFIVINDQEDQA